ncbi:MAG: hypothetical protein SGPRY_010448, partial [Prymnesium sp.]
MRTRIFFADDVIRESIQERPFPAHLAKGDEKPIQFRFELALQRLIERVGEGWLRQTPRSSLDLKMMREKVIDLLCRPSSAAEPQPSRKRGRVSRLPIG